METFSALLVICKQWWGWWFETLLCPLWRHCNVPDSFKWPIAILWQRFVVGHHFCPVLVSLFSDNIDIHNCHYGDVIMDTNGVSNHQPHHCLLNRLFGCRSNNTSKLRVIGLCVGNSPGTGEFPAQMASNAENVSIWWRHHAPVCCMLTKRHQIWNHQHLPLLIFTNESRVDLYSCNSRARVLRCVVEGLVGLCSIRRRRLTGIVIPMISLRRSDDRLRFIMRIPILIRRRLLSE